MEHKPILDPCCCRINNGGRSMSIKCAKCGSTNLGFMGDLTISAPIEFFHRLSKAVLRSKDIRIWGFDWGKADIICNDCYYSSALDHDCNQGGKINENWD